MTRQNEDLGSDTQEASVRVGTFSGEGPPVPIPNTAVKLTSAKNTCLETDRENRAAPTQMKKDRLNSLSFLFYILSGISSHVSLRIC